MPAIDTELLYYSEDPFKFTKRVRFKFDNEDLIEIRNGNRSWIYAKIHSLLEDDFLSECKNLHVKPDLEFFEAQFEDIKKEVNYVLCKSING